MVSNKKANKIPFESNTSWNSILQISMDNRNSHPTVVTITIQLELRINEEGMSHFECQFTLDI